MKVEIDEFHIDDPHSAKTATKYLLRNATEFKSRSWHPFRVSIQVNFVLSFLDRPDINVLPLTGYPRLVATYSWDSTPTWVAHVERWSMEDSDVLLSRRCIEKKRELTPLADNVRNTVDIISDLATRLRRARGSIQLSWDGVWQSKAFDDETYVSLKSKFVFESGKGDFANVRPSNPHLGLGALDIHRWPSGKLIQWRPSGGSNKLSRP